MTTTCPSCGEQSPLSLGRLQDSSWFAGQALTQPLTGGHLYRCGRCYLKFRHPLMDVETYKHLYDNALTDNWSDAGENRLDWAHVTAIVESRIPQGGSVLDFGCYSGGLLARLGDQYDRYGVEINRHAATIARSKGCATVVESLTHLPAGLRFDVVIAVDVIEHVPNPLSLIEQLLTKVADNGVLILSTGDGSNRLWRLFGANWWYCHYLEHISFLSHEWLDYFAARGCFRVLRCESFVYRRMGVLRRSVEALFMLLYGLFPYTFLAIKHRLHRLHGSERQLGVPGSGVTADHLLIVLSRACRT